MWAVPSVEPRAKESGKAHRTTTGQDREMNALTNSMGRDIASVRSELMLPAL